jgi:TRAP-type mannitol/chloroaromatic compound transport system substrate-binding protein
VPAGAPPARQSEAAEAWAAAKDSRDVAVLQAFIARYKDTFFAELARARVEELKKQQVAVATPAPAPPPPPAAKQEPGPPAVAAKQLPSIKERSFRLTSSYPKSMTDIYAPTEQFVREVESAAPSKLKMQLFAAGEIVPGLQVLDAVQNGTVELGWTFAAYYWGKEPAFAAASGAVPFGIDASAFARWMQGSGKSVRDQLFATFGVKAIPCSITGPKALMLRKPVKGVDDMKGLKLRVGGATAQALAAMGVVPQQVAGGDIYPKLEKGEIDGAEWLTPPMDEKLGFTKVARYYYYPFGEPTFSVVSDLIINKKVWDELEPAAQQVFESACSKQLQSDLARLSDGVMPALQRMAAGGAIIGRLPDAIAAKFRQGASDTLEQNIKSAPGLALWRSLKSVR